jgi:hypothetical protein
MAVKSDCTSSVENREVKRPTSEARMPEDQRSGHGRNEEGRSRSQNTTRQDCKQPRRPRGHKAKMLLGQTTIIAWTGGYEVNRLEARRPGGQQNRKSGGQKYRRP